MVEEPERGILRVGYFLSATFRLRPARRLRFIILRPCLVFIRARKPIERFLFRRLVRCG